MAVLAGGRGQRLGGRDKAGLLVGGRSMLARQLEVLSPRFSWRALVGSSAPPTEAAGWTLVPDLRPGVLGPLVGLEAALTEMPAGLAGLMLVACDMPFVRGEVVDLLAAELARVPHADAVVPVVADEPQPLLAVYRADLRPLVTSLLDRGVLSLRRLLAASQVTWLDEAQLRAQDPDLLSFFNVNTPEALEEAERMAR